MNPFFPVAVFIGVTVFTLGIGIVLFHKDGCAADAETHDLPRDDERK